MANNRLYIKDAQTGEEFLLATSFGDGWELFTVRLGAVLIDEGPPPEDIPGFIQRLNEWLEAHDHGASYGGCDQMTATTLKLICENTPEE